MEKALLVIVQVVLFPTIPGLFTVEMTNNSYLAEIGGVITMECRFPAEDGVILSGLNVHWHRIQSSGSLEVYRLVNGQEDLTFQHSQYKGRVCLQKEKLPMGLAVLQISNLSISDSGKYRCLIELGGADYKEFTLTVRAAYKPIKKDIRKTEEDNMVELSCQSEGYPLTSVLWRDATGKKLSMKANTTYFKTVKHLFHLSSQVIITTTNNNTYTCTFLDEAGMGFSASFKIPDDLRNSTDFHLDYRNRNTLTTVMAILISALILTVVVAIVAYHRLKEGGSYSPPSTTASLLSALLEGLQKFVPTCRRGGAILEAWKGMDTNESTAQRSPIHTQKLALTWRRGDDELFVDLPGQTLDNQRLFLFVFLLVITRVLGF